MTNTRHSGNTRVYDKFSRQDFFVLAFLVVLGVALTFIIYRPTSANSAEQLLEVRQDGTVLMTLSMSKNVTKTIEGNDGAINSFSIENGVVSMQEANCHDSTCIRTGKISRTGETIVCLPHRLVLKIISGDGTSSGNDVDAVVQ